MTPVVLLLLLAGAVRCSGQAPAPAPESQADIRTGLLRFADSIPDFYQVANVSGRGWTPTAERVCDWKHIVCSNASLALNLSYIPFTGTVQSSWGQDLAGFEGVYLNNTYLQGTLPAAWAQDMPRLVHLDLGWNWNITGSFPTEWVAPNAFPRLHTLYLTHCSTRSALQSLTLEHNSISGPLPAEWGEADTFPSLVLLNLSSCNLTGPLPDWGSQNGSFASMTTIYLSRNNLSTTLPASWSNLSSLTLLDADHTNLQGTLPPAWGNFSELRFLYLYGNSLTGTLPTQWATTEGVWPSLSILQLQNNKFSGTLPNWGGSNHGWASLSTLELFANRLTGTIPYWGPSGDAGLNGLVSLVIDNSTGICGQIPPNLNVEAVSNDTASGTVTLTTLPPCPGDPPEAAPASTAGPDASPPGTSATLQQGQSARGSGSLGSGAIAGIVVGAVAAVALSCGLLMWLLLRRRMQQRSRKHKEAEQAPAQNEAALISGSDKSRSTQGSPSDSRPASPLTVFLNQSTGSSANTHSISSFPSESQHSSGTPITGDQASSTEARVDLGPSPGGYLSSAQNSGLQLDWKVEPHRLQISRTPNGKYWLLGAGACGEVYKGVMDGVYDVAIKLLKPEAISATDGIQDFLAEIDVLRACRDEHVVAFRGAWANQDIMYYVTEYAENGDLFTALRGDRLDERLSWHNTGKSIALQVAKGLFYLHSNNIVHLDIKSPNILLTKQWQAKIADAGLARILLSRTHLSRIDGIGTYDWQAPETLLGLHSSFSADIFGFGVVMLEIICGTRPVRGQYPEPRVPEQCPEEIRALAAQCMQPEPRDRPTAREIISTIQELHPDA
ncbi:hypothetical protein WJX73_008032 [Symbiochloris irregularis]|uniref:Protein kinase domain-containing protein n=1 Tax=Symbiochloris irregularis TaxID=706552 RepID=A0AAW1PI53_9CHLO